MGRFRRLATVLMSLGLLASPAGAATFLLREVSKPAIPKLPGRVFDVLGIAPGMDQETVRQILKKEYGEFREQRDTMGIGMRGVAVESQPFVTTMSAQKGGDQITVWFGNPTTGGGVVEVSRQTNYFDPAKAPDINQLRAEFAQRFGPPADERAATSSGELVIQDWAFEGTKVVGCKTFPCASKDLEGLDIKQMEAYQRAVRTGHHLVITTAMLATTTDPRRASTVWVTINDLATKVRTLESAMSQMKSAASSRHGGKPAEGGRGGKAPP